MDNRGRSVFTTEFAPTTALTYGDAGGHDDIRAPDVV